MAYTNMDRNRPATLALVAALHAGAIYALVVGLAGPVWRMIEDPPLAGEQIPLPKPSPQVIETPVVEPQPKITGRDQSPTKDFTVTTTNTLSDEREIILPPVEPGSGDIAGDLPPPPPQPQAETFAPKLARPMGRPGSWVTPNDYPAADLRAEHEGTTRIQLSIGADGKVQSCLITASSGFASLDKAACVSVQKRGKFAAATDATGAAVASTYTSAVHWKIPKD